MNTISSENLFERLSEYKFEKLEITNQIKIISVRKKGLNGNETLPKTRNRLKKYENIIERKSMIYL